MKGKTKRILVVVINDAIVQMDYLYGNVYLASFGRKFITERPLAS